MLDANTNIDFKPNIDEYKKLEHISKMPSCAELNHEDRNLLRKFSKYLAENGKKTINLFFTQAIDWTDQNEVARAKLFLNIWQNVEVSDAIGLLTISDVDVRSFAVGILNKASNDELELYLFMLVQGLCIEAEVEDKKQVLVRFLIEKCASDFKLGNKLFWLLTVECDPVGGKDGLYLFFSRVKARFNDERIRLFNDYHVLNERQLLFVEEISRIQRSLLQDSAPRQQKIGKLRELVKNDKFFKEFF